jgi:tetratricopeptide (TPR) repeat protein
VFYKRNIAISLGIVFFLITIFPFLNIIIPLPGMMADRFLLIPSIGFCIAVAGALHFFIRQGASQFSGIGSIRLLPLVPKVALTLLALVYSGFTIARNVQWENHLILFEHDIKHLDESTQAHNLLALQYIIYSFDQKDPAVQLQYRLNAEKHLKRAIEIYPQFFNPHYDLGRLNEMMGKPDSALIYYSKTVTIDSTFPTPYLNASRIMQAKNDLRGSVAWLEQGLRVDTLDMEWYNLLSFDLYRLNDFKGSVDINKLAIRRIGRTPDLLAHIGQAYLSATELDSARVYLEQANALNPNIQGLQGALQQLNKLQPPTNTPATQAIQPK